MSEKIKGLKEAKECLDNFGFTPITPSVFAGLLEGIQSEAIAALSKKLTDHNCIDCEIKLNELEYSEYTWRCSECAWHYAVDML